MFDSVIAGRAQSVTFRRGAAEVGPFTVRIEKRGNQSPIVANNDGASQVENLVVIVGAAGLDIQVGDRFNDTVTGDLYTVKSVHPHREVVTQAIAVMVE